jgi:predicted RNase H-like nuclease (RuvC/YqgF family)
MDAKFLSAYNEVALDNFVAVVKQNILFQTQVKFLEDQVKIIPGLQEKVGDFARIIEENSDLKNQLNNRNSIIQNSVNSDVEKNRLQTALNSQSKELAKLREDTAKQKEYITQLEEMLPNSKKKKLGIDVLPTKDEVKEDEPQIKNDDVLKVESAGGSF